MREMTPSKISVSDLDVAVSMRQAFAGSYSRPKNLKDALASYRSGKLLLPPQPVWVGEPTDWAADPFKDRNWRFQHHTLRWMNPLRWAALDGDEDARVEWLRIARSWGERNIPASKSPSDFAWKDMADGNRSIQLSLGAPLVKENDEWYIDLLQYHRDWLMDESHIVGKNHGLHQHSGLLVLGSVLRDQEAIDTAVSRMRKQFASTFDAQGANDEGSSTYHQMNMSWWSSAWKRVKLEGIDPPQEVQERLELASRVLAHIALPDGQLPQIGDAKRTKVSIGHSHVTDFVASGGSIGTPPDGTALILDRGYVLSRSGWGHARPLENESHMLARFGENARSHSHQDRGSLHIYAAGQRWLIDSGFHSYQPSAPEVRYLKSREAHNVASIVGLDHDDTAPVNLVASNISDSIHDFTFCDSGYANAKLIRRVIYFVDADCWVVSDIAVSDEPVEITHRWHVEPGVSSRVLDNGFGLTGDAGRFGMYWLGRGTRLGRTIPREGSLPGWIGTKWKTLIPGTVLTAKSTKDRPHLVTLLGAHSPMPLGIVESRVSASGRISLHIARGADHWRIVISDEALTIKKK